MWPRIESVKWYNKCMCLCSLQFVISLPLIKFWRTWVKCGWLKRNKTQHRTFGKHHFMRCALYVETNGDNIANAACYDTVNIPVTKQSKNIIAIIVQHHRKIAVSYTLSHEYRVWEIDILSCYSLLRIAFAPICACNNRRIWRHRAITSRSRVVKDQLWWRHNAKSEKFFLGSNGEMNERWLFKRNWLCRT